jgi:hypothetical protein
MSIFGTYTEWILFAVKSTSCVNATLIGSASVCSFRALVNIDATRILSIGNERTLAELGNTITAVSVVANTLVLVLNVVVNNALRIDVTIVLIAWRFVLVLDNFLVKANKAAGGINAVLLRHTSERIQTLVNIITAVLLVALITRITNTFVVLVTGTERNTG